MSMTRRFLVAGLSCLTLVRRTFAAEGSQFEGTWTGVLEAAAV